MGSALKLETSDVIVGQQSTLRTVEPTNRQVPGFSRGVNLLKIVKDHADVELEEMDAEIAGLETKLKILHHKRQYVQRLREIAFSYTPL